MKEAKEEEECNKTNNNNNNNNNNNKNNNNMNNNNDSPELQSLLERLRPFQREAFDRCTQSPSLSNGTILLADEMGLGNAIHIVSGFNDVDFVSSSSECKKVKSHIQIIICTYSLLQTRSAAAKALMDIPFECVIADESHNLKDRKSQRAQYAIHIMQQCQRKIFMSGTPALAKPCELWVQLYCLDAIQFGKWSWFIKRYCNAHEGRFGLDYGGLSNADELHDKISKVMIRRLKRDVLDDLPPKQRMVIPVSISGNKENRDACRDIMEQIQQARDDVHSFFSEETAVVDSPNTSPRIRQLISQAYQLTGIGKAHSVADYVIDYVSGSDSKVILFAHHKAVMDILESKLRKSISNKTVSHIRIDGTTPSILRCTHVKSFQNNPSIRVALLSVTAAGTGLTLTAASAVIFAELHWTPGVLVQAEDRAHRIGQMNSRVNIMYCACKEEEVSLDSYIWKTVGRRLGALRRVVDGMKGHYVFAKEGSNTSTAPTNTTPMEQSSEEELTTFFATMDTNSSKTQMKPPHSKGSIQSFFTKQMNHESNKSSTTSSATGKDATTCTNDWSCTACTLLNKSYTTSCEICQTSKVQPQITTIITTPDKSTFTTSTMIHKPNIISPPPKNKHEETVKHTITNTTTPYMTMSDYNRNTLQENNDTTILSPSSSQNTFDSECFVLKDSSLMDSSSESESESVSNEDNDIVSRDHDDDGNNININNNNNNNNSMIDLTDCFILDDDDDSESDDDICILQKPTMHTATSRLEIELDDDSSSNSSTIQTLSLDKLDSFAKEHDSDDCFILDDDILLSSSSESQDENDHDDNTDSTTTTTHLLSFGVSKNTGRIFLHNYATNDALNVNFDINDMVSKTSLDNNELVRPSSCMKRSYHHFSREKNAQLMTHTVVLNDDYAVQLLKSIDWDKIVQSSSSCSIIQLVSNEEKDNIIQQMQQEIQLFLSTYLALNNIEKNILQNTDTTTTSYNVRQVVSQIMLQSSTTTSATTNALNTTTNARYADYGAMEKALLSQTTNTTTEVDEAVLNHQSCAWCAKPLPPSCLQTQNIIYCSQTCAEEGRLKRDCMYTSTRIRASIFALEQGKCRKCGIDAHSLFHKIHDLDAPSERLNVLCNANWRLPVGRTACERFLHSPKEGDFWQVDHIKAVAEGGGTCGIENFQTLCTPCHKIETDHLRKRLKLKHNKPQMDIRLAFTASRHDPKRYKV